MIFVLTKNKDSVIINVKTVSMGVVKVKSLTDTIDGINAQNTVIKHFKASVDGCNWSEDWILCTDANLQSLKVKKNHPFCIKFRYEKIGDDTTPITIQSINVDMDYVNIQPPKSFEKIGIFEGMYFWNQDSLQWYVNVLRKIYDQGILPKYIERSSSRNENWEDEDFLDFWFPMIYLYALVFKRQIETSHLNHYKKILFEFLKQRGITPSYVSDLGDLYEIASEFIKMMSMRGSVDMITKKDRDNDRYNDGELIRIFGINSDTDEFQLVGLKSGHIPWCLNVSSPCYSSLNGIEEASKKTISQKYAYGYISDNTETSRDKGTEVPVNIKQSYIVEFDIIIKSESDTPYNVDMLFGAVGLDVYGNKVEFSTYNQSEKTSYFVKKTLSVVSNKTYHFYGIIYSKNEFDVTNQTTSSKNSYGFGSNMVFTDPSIVKMYTFLYALSNTTQFVVENYSVKPLKTEYSRMFINDSNQYILVSKNKNYDISEEELKEYISNNLMPYDSTTLFKLL